MARYKKGITEEEKLEIALAKFRSRTKRLENGCIVWTAGTTDFGYGAFKFNYQNLYAHKWIYELTHGPVAEGNQVCHSCDNPPCVNLEHLFEGTPQENALDRLYKGRNSAAKINLGIAREIRALRAQGIMPLEISRKVGLNPTTVGDILRNKHWVE